LSEAEKPTLCRVCREEIKPGAQKCIHCGSTQGWQRHLAVSSTVLALLVALISVLQSALPVFIAAYNGNASKVSMNFLKADGHSGIFAASNSGNRPGTLAFGSLILKSPSDEYSFPLEGDSAVNLILPAQITPIKLTLEAGFDGQIISIAEEFDGPTPETKGAATIVLHRPMSATLSVEVIQFDGTKTPFTWPVYVLCGGKACSLSTTVPELFREKK